MGFKLPQRTIELAFQDEFKGAKVEVILDHPLGMLIEAQALQTSEDEGEQDLEGICRFLARILLSWNLEEEDGTPIPATEEGLHKVTPAFIAALITVWVDAQTKGLTPAKKSKSKRGQG